MTESIPLQHPLTLPQREIWLDQMRHGDSALYNIGGYMRLEGEIDLERFREAARLLVQRHDVLRTVLLPASGDDGIPSQVFLDQGQAHVPLIDLSNETDPEQSALQWTKRDLAAPFALHGEPLFRYALLRLGVRSFQYFACYHHLIADGWTVALLARSHAAIYNALEAGERLPPGPSYTAFIEDDRRHARSDAFEGHRQYWLRKLSPPPEPLLAMRRHHGEVAGAPRSGCSSLLLPRAEYDRLSAFAQAHGATPFHAILGALYTYFTRTGQRGELVLGVSVLNRSHAAFKATAGLFAGMTAARLGFGVDLSFGELMPAVARELRQNYRHQRFPIGTLPLADGPARWFDIGVSYERHDYQAMFGTTRGLALPLVNDEQTTPLMLYVREFRPDDAVQIDFVFNQAYFKPQDIGLLQQRLLHLLAAAQQRPGAPLWALPLATPEECRLITQDWNATAVDYPQDCPVHHSIERQVRRTPDAPALVFEERRLTYRELNEAANRLAHRLTAEGVEPDALVGVCAERSVELVVGLLAILKAGGAYMPLDPDLPRDRLSYMLDDAGVRWLLTQPSVWNGIGLPARGVRIIDLALPDTSDGPTGNPDVMVDAKHLAYMIYTSGSTGKPKGAGLTHEGLNNRLQWMQDTYRLRGDDRVLQKTPFSFDVSVWEFFWPLMTGAVLVVARPGDHKDPARLLDLIQREGITTLHFVPSMLQAFIEHEALPQCHTLRQVMASGEALPAELQRRFHQQSRAALHNLYGPTEASIDVTAWTCDDTSAPSVPIGRPIANTRIYLLDEAMQPVPVGVAGELYIAGVQLARGYHRRPDLTADRFVSDPYGAPGDRMYRSGDLACWRSDGAIEYLGRIDHQVKINGLRIELGEIEAALRMHPAVREAVVVAREDHPGDKRLVAYVVMQEDGSPAPATGCPRTPDTASLKASLDKVLPQHMVPGRFVALDRMPLTPSGKIDRKALPAPSPGPVGQSYLAPGTRSETLLAEIWSDLLKTERIGANDSFFELGGHSLLAAALVSRLRKRLDVELPLRVVFDAPVLHRMAQHLDALLERHGAAQETQASRRAPGKAEHAANRPLSSPQQRLWFLDRLAPGSALYNMAGGVRLRGAVDAAALEAALNGLLRRHDILCTAFGTEGEHPVQRIDEQARVPFDAIDLSSWPPAEREAEARRLAGVEAQRPFDLGVAPLLRATWLRLDAESHWLLLTLHHIAADGVSLAILQRDIAALYRSQLSGEPVELPTLPLQYADFAAWQGEQMHGGPWERDLAYWRRQLDGASPLLDLPADRARPATRSQRGARVGFVLPGTLCGPLHDLSGRTGATLFMTLLAAFGALLSRLCAQDDICIGTPIANRRHAEFDDLIGCFVNMLVMRLKFEQHLDFPALLGQVRETALSAYSHQDMPFEQLVEALQVKPDLGHAPLFQAMFALHRASPPWTLPGLQTEPLDIELPVSKFDLSLEMWEDSQQLRGSFEYSTDLFDRTTIERMIGHFQALLADVVASPEKPVARLNMLAPHERHLLLHTLNQSRHDFPLDSSYAALFAEQAARHPERTAAVCMDQRLSYRELDRRSNRIAHALKDAGAGPDTLVGVLGERDLCFLAMMIAIFKAGAAYVPLDMRHPVPRLREIVERGRLSLLLATGASAGLLDPLLSGLDRAPRCLMADRLWLQGDASALACPASPEHLAYVIFTSGSTGRPKGAMVEQRGMLNNLFGKVPALGLGAEDRVAQTASPAFDISVWQFLAAPLLGATVHILPDMVAHDPRLLLRALAEQQITLLQVVPSMLRQLVDEAADGAGPACLRWVLSIGEALPPRLAEAWFACFPDIPLLNIYGPAECADNVASHAVRSAEQAREYRALGSVPIGRPTANLQLFVLDPHLQPQPIGVPGEICVAGVGVGRGYLDDAETTAKAFVPHPFQPGARFYRTGDIGRYRADGAIDYLGRRDHQVKVRGQRIELGEIEACLRQQPEVDEAVVLGRTDARGETQLVAYWVARTPQARPESLRVWLAARLPAAWVPASFVRLPRLPLNANGKVDRKLLAGMSPEPAVDAMPATQLESPATKTEAALAAIWQDLLARPRIGRTEHFFEAGGHSLLATRLVSRIRRDLRVELPLRTIFEVPVLHELARHIDTSLPPVDEDAPSTATRPAMLPLSFAQQRLWLLDRLEPGLAHYHLPALLRLSGPLDVKALESALNALLARHEALRTAFSGGDGGPVQVILPQVHLALGVSDLQDLEETERERQARALVQKEATAAFDLGAAPLLRAHLLRLGTDAHRLLLTLHHGIADGWSLDILLAEFAALYRAARSGAPATLPALPLQYADYALWQRQSSQEEVRERQLAYWREQLDQAPTLLDLPIDRPRPPLQSHRGARVAVELPDSLSQRLANLGREHGSTQFMTLLAGYAAMLARYSGQSDICIGTPVAGRPRAEFERLIGMFVNTLVLRVRPHGHRSFSALLEAVRETSLAAFAHQDLPFEQLVESLQPQRQLSHAPLFQTMFVLREVATPLPAFEGLELAVADVELPVAKFDLTLALSQREGRISGCFEYASDLFEASTIERMRDHLVRLLQAVVDAPDTPIEALELLSPQERRTQLIDWNRPDSMPRAPQSIQELVEAQVQEHPDDVAVVFEEERLSYRELNRRANRLAHWLRQQGAGPETRVGLCLGRSVEMVVAMLAVVKAGAAYLPLDPALPAARLAWMVEDAQLEHLLTHSSLPHRWPQPGLRAACLDRLDLDGQPADDPPNLNLPGHLAYVIYTSGSTGRPKGVLLQHQGLVHLVLAWRKSLSLSRGLRTLLWFPFHFDPATLDVFSAWSSGCCLHLASDEALLPGENLRQTLLRHRIQALSLTPSALAAQAHEEFADLRSLVCGGERCDRAVIEPWARSVRVTNAYGPTEITVCATLHACAAGAEGPPPIGKPIGRTRAYVLDGRLSPVPVGVVGELYIAGDGVARAYLGRPDLTAERFIADPFAELPGERMYRTGDLARHLPDGNIVYTGRADRQVKLRGRRIEPGEIETALRSLAGVDDACVVLREEGLVAYAVASGAAASAKELRQALRQSLPEYMVPGQVIFLERLPLNANGKLDESGLPPPPVDADQELPLPGTEARLAAIWSELLGRPSTGRTQNFFEAGGHSLLAVQLCARVRTTFDVSVPVSQVFMSPTLAEFAQAIDQRAPGAQLLVPLQGGDTGTPTFLVHPAGGTVFAYGGLARRLGRAGPVFGIQSPEIAGMNWEADSFDALCRRYADDIVGRYPSGPLRLGGWSMGGALALRIAGLLERSGRRIDWVALFDTHLPKGESPLSFADFLNWTLNVQSDALGTDDQLARSHTRLKELLQENGARHVARLLDDELRCQSWLDSQGIDSAYLDFLQRQYRIQQRHAALMQGFEPSPVHAPLHVAWAAESCVDGHAPVDWGLFSRAAQHGSHRVLPGRHETLILGDANLDIIAAHLLDDSGRQSPSVTRRPVRTAVPG